MSQHFMIATVGFIYVHYLYLYILIIMTGLAYRSFESSRLGNRISPTEGFRNEEAGDLAVLIQRIIVGSIAERSRRLKVGDEVVAISEVPVTSIEDAR